MIDFLNWWVATDLRIFVGICILIGLFTLIYDGMVHITNAFSHRKPDK